MPATERNLLAFEMHVKGLTYQKIGKLLPRHDRKIGPLSRGLVGIRVVQGARTIRDAPEHPLRQEAIAFLEANKLRGERAYQASLTRPGTFQGQARASR